MHTKLVIVLTMLFLAGCSRVNERASLRIEPTFQKPITFHIESEGTELFLRVTVYERLGGYAKGGVERVSRHVLSAEEATLVRAALEAVESSSPSDPELSGWRDGSMWYFEGGGLWPKRMEICSPEVFADERGTQPLVNLGVLLQRLGKVTDKYQHEETPNQPAQPTPGS